MIQTPEGANEPSGLKDATSSPTSMEAWGLNGYEHSAADNIPRVNAALNATHAGILASQAQMSAPLAKPQMQVKLGSLNYQRGK